MKMRSAPPSTTRISSAPERACHRRRSRAGRPLFAGNVSKSISFFDLDHDQIRIEAAARLARVHDEIAAVSMCYDSPIDDTDTNSSARKK